MNWYPVQWTGRQAVVTLPGEVDITNSGHIAAVLARALTDGAVMLTADMTATAYCDCSGSGHWSAPYGRSRRRHAIAGNRLPSSGTADTRTDRRRPDPEPDYGR